METKRLYRSCNDKVLGGVAGGLAEYLNFDPTIIRLIFLVMFLSGFGFAAYILAWILIPLDPKCGPTKSGEEEIKDKADEIAKGIKTGEKSREPRMILGATIIAIGLFLLLDNIASTYVWKVLWPVIFVITGFYLIVNSKNRR